MRAYVYQGPHQMPLEDVSFPVPGDEDVVISVRSVGICGSDVHGFRGTTGRRKPPIVMGHEFSGVVLRTGKDVTGWQPGDRVIANPLLVCGHCENCTSGHPNICTNRHGLGVDLDGAYADAVKVHRSMVYALPQQVTFDQGAMVEPLAVAMHAVNRNPFQLSASVVIIGAGTIGLLTMLSAKMRGAGKIILIDPDEHRLKFAEKLGAETINSNLCDPVQTVRDMTAGKGADAVFEAVGITQTADQSLYMAANGASITWIGNSQPEIQINMQQIVTRELNLFGSYGFTREFEDALNAIRYDRIDPMVLVEKSISFNEIGTMISDLAAGKCSPIKVLVNSGFQVDYP